MRQLKSLAIDLFLIATATLLALLLRDNLELSATRIGLILPYLALTIVFAAIVLPLVGTTRTMWRFSGIADYSRLLLACVLIVLLSLSVGFALFRLENVSRVLPVLQLILMAVLLIGLRMAERAHRFRHNSQARLGTLSDPASPAETVIVLGLNAVTELFLQAVTEHGQGRITVAGVIGRSERQTGQLFRSHKVLGVPEDLESIIRELDVHGVSIDRVVVTVAFDQLSPVAKAAVLAVENGTRIKVDYFAERLSLAEPAAHRLEKSVRPKGIFRVSPEDRMDIVQSLRRPYWRHKRRIDAVLALVALVVAVPVAVVVALLTVFSVGSPVVFWQQRPGLHGRPFKVYKFRTLLSAHDWQGRRLPDEMRETLIGRFLRSTRFDELPQLLNIIAGHMSFVGPRPLLISDQLEEFSERLSVRPGLTGWAQVNGGKHVSASDKMALDIWYIRNASFKLDCQIMHLTVKMLLLGEQTNPRAVEEAWLQLSRRS